MVEQAEFQVNPAAGGMKVQQTDRWLAPNHFRQDSRFPAGAISAYSDGASGWIVTPQGAGPLTGAQLQQVRGDLFRLYFQLLLSDRISGRTVSYAGENIIQISGNQGESARIVVDESTGLPQKVVYESVHVAGPPMTVEDRYVRFADVAGIKVAVPDRDRSGRAQVCRCYRERLQGQYRAHGGGAQQETMIALLTLAVLAAAPRTAAVRW